MVQSTVTDSPTCREAVLNAFLDLERSTGRDTFRLQEIVQAVTRRTRRYPDTTIRTQVTSVMCANAPIHHANHTNDLERVERGLYRRLVAHPRRTSAVVETVVSTDDLGQHVSATHDWYWEGNIQVTLVENLVAAGWAIVSTADTRTRQQGPDILAQRGGERLIVEVKGFPSDRYAFGPRVGQPKPTKPVTQARHWYAEALLTAALARSAAPAARVALAFPDFPSYRSLVARTQDVLTSSLIEVMFVSENGAVDPPVH